MVLFSCCPSATESRVRVDFGRVISTSRMGNHLKGGRFTIISDAPSLTPGTRAICDLLLLLLFTPTRCPLIVSPSVPSRTPVWIHGTPKTMFQQPRKIRTLFYFTYKWDLSVNPTSSCLPVRTLF